MNTLDKFFKEKLTDHSVAPSATAWEKVEAGLSKKNNAIIWWRWAAVLLLGTALLGTLWLRTGDEPLPMAAKQPGGNVKPEEKTEVNQLVPAEKSKANVAINKKEVVKKKKSKQQLVPLRREDNETVATVKTDEKELTSEMFVAEVTTEETSVVTKEKSIVLTYTLDYVEPKHTLPTEEVASVEKKDNSFKRVVRFAKDVKNGESSLGGLRVMKEDLFALELRKKNTSKTQ